MEVHLVRAGLRLLGSDLGVPDLFARTQPATRRADRRVAAGSRANGFGQSDDMPGRPLGG
jgi:hypothetical protein